MCKAINVCGFLWRIGFSLNLHSSFFCDFLESLNSLHCIVLHPPWSVGTTTKMAEAEARRNNMLKERCVVLEYKINRLGMQIISISYINIVELLWYDLFPTFEHLAERRSCLISNEWHVCTGMWEKGCKRLAHNRGDDITYISKVGPITFNHWKILTWFAYNFMFTQGSWIKNKYENNVLIPNNHVNKV